MSDSDNKIVFSDGSSFSSESLASIQSDLLANELAISIVSANLLSVQNNESNINSNSSLIESNQVSIAENQLSVDSHELLITNIQSDIDLIESNIQDYDVSLLDNRLDLVEDSISTLEESDLSDEVNNLSMAISSLESSSLDVSSLQTPHSFSLMQISSTGTVFVLDDFYSSNESVVMLGSQNDDFVSFSLGDQFFVNDNELQLNTQVDLSTLSISDQLILSSLSATNTVLNKLVIDSDTGIVYEQVDFSFSNGLVNNNQSIEIDDTNLLDGSLLYWLNNQFTAASVSEDSVLSFSSGVLDITLPFNYNDSDYIGIGDISPSVPLDVNGAFRLRESSVSAMMHNLGWLFLMVNILKAILGPNGKSSNSEVISSSDDFWSSNGLHLVTEPDGNIGIKVKSSGTLDVSGNIRIRSIDESTELSSVLVANSDGDIFYRDISSLINYDYQDITVSSNILILQMMFYQSQQMVFLNTI